jgi:uncharacterized protein YegL
VHRIHHTPRAHHGSTSVVLLPAVALLVLAAGLATRLDVASMTTTLLSGSTDDGTPKLIAKNERAATIQADATRVPIDVSLVLDLSYSLARNQTFDAMQRASKSFVDHFEDDVDRLGLVTYSTWAEDRRPLQKPFKSAVKTLIDSMTAISDTNIEEGLRLAKMQLDEAPHRDDAVKVVVLFTDGRPTAFAGNFAMPEGTNPSRYEGIVASYISGASYRGLFRITDGRKIRSFDDGFAITIDNASSVASPVPQYLPGHQPVTGNEIRDLGASQAEEWANAIRAAGYTIYTIGLGSPDAPDAGDQPDPAFLERLANVEGRANAAQPRGEMVFASSAADLNEAFATVADRIVTRRRR